MSTPDNNIQERAIAIAEEAESASRRFPKIVIIAMALNIAVGIILLSVPGLISLVGLVVGAAIWGCIVGLSALAMHRVSKSITDPEAYQYYFANHSEMQELIQKQGPQQTQQNKLNTSLGVAQSPKAVQTVEAAQPLGAVQCLKHLFGRLFAPPKQVNSEGTVYSLHNKL